MTVKRFAQCACLAAVVTGWPAGSAAGAGLDAQRIVVRNCIELLPEPLASYFREHLDELQERVVEPETVWPRDKQMQDHRLWHRVAMDVASDEQTLDARLAAARNFPLDQADAKSLYRRLERRGGDGALPWAIEQLYHELTDAMRQGDEDEIIRRAAFLAHFAAKAACPFNASADYDGKLTGNLCLGRVSLGHPDYAHRDVAARFFGELVRRNCSRYADQLHLSRGDYDPVLDPLHRVRSMLMASLSVLDEVAQADAEIVLADGDHRRQGAARSGRRVLPVARSALRLHLHRAPAARGCLRRQPHRRRVDSGGQASLRPGAAGVAWRTRGGSRRPAGGRPSRADRHAKPAAAAQAHHDRGLGPLQYLSLLEVQARQGHCPGEPGDLRVGG